MKVYRGSAAAARSYVEADRSRVDDYYLTEGTGLAERFVARRSLDTGFALLERRGDLDGPAYEGWVAGYDVETGRAKGRLRTDDQAVRFVEVVVNGPKTWSLAALLHPEIAAAYDAAQERAAGQVIGWLAEHATTRVGPRGRQVQVPVEEIEAVVVRHYTSRAGDPHRHLHLQVNARVWAAGTWRGLHTVGVRDSLDALNGIGHAAVVTDPEFRAVLAAHGYRLDLETGEVVELAGYAGAFSARAAQIGRNVDRYEAQWRAEHPDVEPGPGLRRAWDRRAWAEARPDKVVPVDGAELALRWVDELHELGFREPRRSVSVESARIGWLDRDAVVETVLTRLGVRRSGWNGADVRGEVERHLAAAAVVADAPVRRELAEDLTSRVLGRCVPLLGRGDVPEHVRALTSPRVLAVERDLTTRLTTRAQRAPGRFGRRTPPGVLDRRVLEGLDDDQRRVVTALAGGGGLTVIEGAAGTGKTTTFAAARVALEAAGHRMMVVTPTRKAAQVAAGQIGTGAHSVAWLLHQWGYRWDDDGRWGRIEPDPSRQAVLYPGDLLLVDEAGMLDQDTARALFALADGLGVRVALVGDRHQLPAVGRGGVLDLANRYAPEACVSLESVHRFTDPAYADLSLRMRRGASAGEVFDALLARGEVVLHPSEVERLHALGAKGSMPDAPLVIADTREQVAQLNALIHDVRVATREVMPGVVTLAGERIGVGDRIATRRNDPGLDVANRETWTVTRHGQDGSLDVNGRTGTRNLPAAYVHQCVELAYATTVYGAQGETVHTAHLLVGKHTGASSAYVAMTRGRDHNTAHLVADTIDDARRQWIEVFGRDRADLGPTHAARLAAEDVERYGPTAPRRPPAIPPPHNADQEAAARMRRASQEDYRPPSPSTSRGIGI